MSRMRKQRWAWFGVSSLSSLPVFAHVKWFSQSAHLQDEPLTLSQIATPTFYALAVLSVVVIIGLTLLDDPLQGFGPYKQLRAFLKDRENHAHALLRIATGMSLLLSWGNNVLLAPDLPHTLGIVSWLQFLAILCLIDRRSAPVAGAVVWVLYAIGIYLFGVFHMLDYAAFLGIGFYLLFRDNGSEKIRAWVKPLLFGTTGFSLAWLALEKLVFPTWGLVLLEQNPVLGLNLPPRFFLTAAAFVELSLGFLLMLGVLGRPLALVITLVFFLTTMVFGKHEVVGHLVLHGVLLVFMLEGTSGPLRPPFRLHRAGALRIAFVSVNFVIVSAALLYSYVKLASPRKVEPLEMHQAAPEAGGPGLAVPPDEAPRVMLTAQRSGGDGWKLALALERFRISSAGPKTAGVAHGEREGHVHLFVDGKLRGMIFSTPYELPSLPPGQHVLTVQLSTPDHRTLIVHGSPVESSVTVEEKAE